MASIITETDTVEDFVSNPIDCVEEMVAAQEWSFSRYDQDEMAVEVVGRCGTYRMHFLWRSELNAMYFSCAMDTKISAEKRRDVYELLATANESLWLGHFDLSREDGQILFRHTCLLRGMNDHADPIEDLIEIALMECDRFYPAFEMVLQSDVKPSEALGLAIIDTVGEA